jgi:hypothetical protein
MNGITKLSCMLQSISWSQYITTIITLLILYYCFVGFKYFRWEILSLIGIKKVEDNTIAIPALSNTNQSFKRENPADYLPKSNLEIDISPLVQSFIDEVQAYVQETNPKAQQAEVLYSLQLIASKYPGLRESDCRDELFQTIYGEVNYKYPGLFEITDFKNLWK